MAPVRRSSRSLTPFSVWFAPPANFASSLFLCTRIQQSLGVKLFVIHGTKVASCVIQQPRCPLSKSMQEEFNSFNATQRDCCSDFVWPRCSVYNGRCQSYRSFLFQLLSFQLTLEFVLKSKWPIYNFYFIDTSLKILTTSREMCKWKLV